MQDSQLVLDLWAVVSRSQAAIGHCLLYDDLAASSIKGCLQCGSCKGPYNRSNRALS